MSNSRVVGDRGGATPATLADRTMTAAQWRFSGSILQAGLRFAIGILLARLLTPDDFGLVAFALVIVGAAGLLTDLGFGPALVQRRSMTERHIRVCFTASSLLGLTTAAALFTMAPLCGSVLHNAALPPVVRLLAITFVFTGAGATAHSLLRRTLDFRRLFFIGLLSYTVGYACIGVGTALLGFGVWSLVYAAVAETFLSNALAVAVVRHPVRPLMARHEVGQLLHFGVGANLNMIANYTAGNGDKFVVGQALGAAALGLYARAFNLMKLPMEYFDGVMWAVLFPAFSEIGQDSARLGRAYLMGVQATAVVAGPMMAGMIVAAPHIIAGLYGPRWLGASAPFQLLCLVGFFRAFDNVGGALTHASGRVYREVIRQSVYALLVIGGSLAGTVYGVNGVAIGVAIAILYMYVAMAQLSLAIIGREWRAFFRAQVPGVILGVAVATVAVTVRAVLEPVGVASAFILLALVSTSLATTAITTYLLPTHLRPIVLFEMLGGRLAGVPAPVRVVIVTVLRGRGLRPRPASPRAHVAGFDVVGKATVPERGEPAKLMSR